MIRRILVVCAGNICRSPMAAALFAHAASGVTVESAGITAVIGSAADPLATDLMRERGLDIRSHRARQFESWMGAQADLVIVMDHGQRKFVEERYPSMRGRVYRLGDYARPGLRMSSGFDVPDPYRQDRAAFESSLRLIEVGVAGWVVRMSGRASVASGA
ncbi:putative low molecular weight protein-tyrosine-phosphatase EpsP [Paraburkholderia tropica]|uniref:low molecular weight protein-tyrosine-phosphatase n=1 Tax=Paraburkholderia tropica TaxID=92647 RepID=UPI001CB3B3CF|nr:low molecular weight protein-tyrosine-phosphatase [Paraburkholderia tropica]CAG9238476.1 putative low molecular weight protein-tyrosine-phosphatase EpsP [Paraburkholderia tropica]